MTERPGYLREFLDFWSPRPEVRRIWFSLFTPQKGETSYEILPRQVRAGVLDELGVLKNEYPKLDLAEAVLRVYRNPPRNPDECLFARTTLPISADLQTIVTPWQFGGTPDCSQCGCFASAALGAVLRHRLPLVLSLGTLYEASCAVGDWMKSLRRSNHPASDLRPQTSTSGPPRPEAGSRKP